jgi:hypothetical protein
MFIFTKHVTGLRYRLGNISFHYSRDFVFKSWPGDVYPNEFNGLPQSFQENARTELQITRRTAFFTFFTIH